MPSNRRWHRSFFLNIGAGLFSGGFGYIVAGWHGVLIAVVSYLLGGLVLLSAAAESNAIYAEEREAQYREYERSVREAYPAHMWKRDPKEDA